MDTRPPDPSSTPGTVAPTPGAVMVPPSPGIPLNYKTFLTVFGITAVYLLLSAVLIGFKTDQLFLAGLFNVLFWLSGPTRRFILGFSVFIIFWIIFDFMKAFPNYQYNTVHIASVYHAEKCLFGIHIAPGLVLTPNEFWKIHSHTFLDILSGLFYLCWIPLPLAFAGYLFYKDKETLFRFTLTFLLVNLLGFIVYYAYPAAPPWYVQLYGFDFHAHTPGNTAGLGRFDGYFHRPVFSSLYAKSSNVFAAMPSLHASYPLVVLYYGIRRTSLRWTNVLFGTITAGIWFAAVYSGHHYVLDVLAGICCGLTGITLFNYLFKKVGWFSRFVKTCAARIS
jgi:hypothetical protein